MTDFLRIYNVPRLANIEGFVGIGCFEPCAGSTLHGCGRRSIRPRPMMFCQQREQRESSFFLGRKNFGFYALQFRA
jgi:hypothetical protein